MQYPGFSRSLLSAAALLALSATVCAQPAAPAGDAPVQTLPAVRVNASADASADGLTQPYAGGQVARGGRVGLLGNQDVMDTPFSLKSYTQELIQNQQAASIGDVLLNDPAVRVARGFGNYQQVYMLRGFPVFSDDVSYNGLYGLLPRQYLAAELIERVEVFLGPSALLNGAAPGGSGIGGAINLVPKRASNEPLTQVTVGVESGGLGYVAADVSRRFGPDGATGIRVNAVHRNGTTSVDDADQTLSALAVGLDWHSSNVRLSADVGYQNHVLDAALPNVNVAAGVAVPKAPDASKNFAQPWTNSKERDLFGTLRGEVDLTPQITAWAAGGTRRTREDGDFSTPTVLNAAGDTNGNRFANSRKDAVISGELGIRGKLQTGSVSHKWSAVASGYEKKEDNAFAFSDFAGFGSNLYNPVDVAAPALDPSLFPGGVVGAPLLVEKIKTTSVALVDTLGFMQDRLLVTLGARHQRIENTAYDYTTGVQTSSYGKSAVTPVAAVMFKANDQVSVYANYIEALIKGETAPAASGSTPISNAGEVFSPTKSKQKEVGLKFDGGKVGGSLALFTIDKPMSLIDNGVFGMSGEQRNRGVEAAVFGEPMRGLRLLGGVTFLDGKQRRTQSGATDGKKAIGVPKSQLNLGAEWDVPGMRGLSVNGRALYTSAQFLDGANTQEVPSWTRFDLGARYVVNLGDRLLTLRARVDNVADRNYWASAGGFPGSGYLVLGAPRTFTVSASVDF